MLSTTPSSFLFGAILALSSISSVAAAKCHVIGFLHDNTIWSPPGGPVVSGGQGLQFFRGDEMIHEWHQCDKCSGVCVDIKNVETPPLPQTFGWAASCNGGKFTECHGSYGDQTHIDGEEPHNDDDFYGIGYATTSQCRIDFDCED